MSSRRFFYFLSTPEAHLDFRRAVRVLSEEGLSFDSSAFVNTIDDNGVLLSVNERVLEPPTERDLGQLLGEGKNVQVMCNDKAIAMNCTFGSPHPSPIFSINTSRKMWFDLDESTREQYERIFVRVADEAGAANILVLDDPADDFLGRLEGVDDQWMVDLRLPDGTEYDAATVWVNTKVGSSPCMRKLSFTSRCIGDFQEFEEQLR